MINRRDFLAAGAVVAASPLFARTGLASVPVYTVRPGPARARLMGAEGPETDVWAYGGRVPGPAIRIPQGKPMHIRLENGIEQPTTVHWHGIRIANAMDGVPGLTQDAVASGKSFDYRFTAPDAGTYWYHSHEKSWEQVTRGLYGPLIVEEAEMPAFDDDLLFVADDWRLTEGGALTDDIGRLGDATHAGRLGNWMTVNGDTAPVYNVRPGARLRLRCISAANARIMAFRFVGVDAHVIAVDGQPLETPEPLTEDLLMAPAQRTDLVIDIPVDASDEIAVKETSTEEPITAATFVVSGTPLRERGLGTPAALPANPLPRLDLSDTHDVDLVMEGGAMGRMAQATYKGEMFDMRTLVTEKGLAWALNGVAGKPGEPLLAAPVGRTVTVDMINDTRWPHAMHLHGHHFRVVERNGQTVRGAPWRDTELVEVGERVRIAFVADNPGKWLFHCHMLEHHMAGMGTWLTVG